MSPGQTEFSFQARERTLKRFRDETFDLLVIGGGIIGSAVARDAVTRGLKVALVERGDFAQGTSSRSSKLIHGGLRYLQNLEFSLVFEALSERALLLKTSPHLVRPLPFYLPVYHGDPNGKAKLSLGLWLYDMLALFRAPGFHKNLSRKSILKDIPFLKEKGLVGGFKYYDASMWDDVIAVETARAAHYGGAAIANYVEAVGPSWKGNRIVGFRIRDLEQKGAIGEIDVRAERVVICAGPWTDLVGKSLATQWKNWLMLSKGVHLIFDWKRIPIPGAMVMSNPDDGRISFVMPRPDLGAGVTIVGTTDGPAPSDPSLAKVEQADIDYLMRLLEKYFPELKLTDEDILSAYVGVRPLFGAEAEKAAGAGGTHAATHGDNSEASKSLQKVSREHHIAQGPGGVVIVTGGKYTTHRRMAAEIVDYALARWTEDAKNQSVSKFPSGIGKSRTKSPVNPNALPQAVEEAKELATRQGLSVPPELFERYGADALDVMDIDEHNGVEDPPGFPHLEGQLRHAIRKEMVLHLTDFYFRRQPLFSSRKDHGLPWAERLALTWAEEMSATPEQAKQEVESLRAEIAQRNEWKKS